MKASFMQGGANKAIGSVRSVHENVPAGALTPPHFLTSAMALRPSILDHCSDAVVVCDSEGIITYWNQGATSLYGWTETEAIGSHLVHRFPPDERSSAMERYLQALKQPHEASQWLDCTKQGGRLWVDSFVYSLPPPSREMDEHSSAGLICLHRRATELHSEPLNGESSANEDSFDASMLSVLESMIEGCQIIDYDFRYVYLNPTALRQANRELSELVGQRMSQAFPGIETTELYAVLARCMRERMVCRFENEFAFPNGTRGIFDLHIVPTPQGLLIYSIDITESRRLASQMRQAQKIVAIGQLAAGAAHDLANLLTVVNGSSEMLLERLEPGSTHRAIAQNIYGAAERCSDIVSQILAFRRQATLQCKAADLVRVAEASRSVLQQLVGDKIHIEMRLESLEGSVNLSPSQLERVLVNLAVNARDAMPDGGNLGISLSEEEASSTGADGKTRVVERCAKLSIRDTGVGMPEDVMARLFEPFFTTKAEGKGAGLGLPTVYNLVKRAGGSISVESSLGAGATFHILLPIFD